MTALETGAAPPDAAERLAAGPAAGDAAPDRSVRLRVVVRMRPAWAWTGICGFTALSAFSAVGAWLGDARMPSAAALHAAAATFYWWYLRYPMGLYEPASNSYVAVMPFGLAWRRRPTARRGGGLALRGDRIVEASRPWRMVIAGAVVREGDWRTVARSVRRSPGRPQPASPPDRPGFITKRHRRAGVVVTTIAAVALIDLSITSLTFGTGETGAEHAHEQLSGGRLHAHRTSIDGSAPGLGRQDQAAISETIGNET